MHRDELFPDNTPGIPEQARSAMMDAYLKSRARDLEAARQYQARAEQAAKVYSRQMASVIGPAKMAKLLAFRQEQRRALQAARDRLSDTPAGLEEFRARRRALVQKSTILMKDLGINVARVKQIRKSFREKKAALYAATIGKAQREATPVRRKKNTDYSPPFSGAWNFEWSWRKKGDPTDDWQWGWGHPVRFDTDHQIGWVGASTGIGVRDASDYDEWNVDLRSAITKWYRMPSTGHVRVRVQGTLKHFHNGYVYDEWGWSELFLSKRIQLWAQIWAPVTTGFVVFSEPLNQVDTNESDHEWNTSTNKSVNFGPFQLPGSFQQNTWVKVAVGVWLRHHMDSNDTEVESRIGALLKITTLGLTTG